MKKISLNLFFIFCVSFAFGQINSNIGGARKLCFQKALDRLDDRYPEWECDVNGGKIIDCNQSLQVDPESNVVFNQSSGRPFTGDCETCHGNGIREHFVHYENGRLDGTDTSYYSSGCPQVVSTYIQGVENGKWVYYNDTSGLIAWEINYFNGVKHGTSTYFRQKRTGEATAKYKLNGAVENWAYGIYENDTVKIESFVDGIINGVKKEYYWPGSKLHKLVTYNMGILDGPFIEYNPEGKLLQELNYVKGQKDGEWKYYYDDGSLLRTESWNKDTKDGEFKTFYIQGTIQTIENYRKGVEHGKFMERFPDDKIKREAFYKKGKLIEEHVYDKYGNEIKTVGGESNNKEDDALPETGKKKKKKEKKKKTKEK